MYCLDTSIVVAILRNEKGLAKKTLEMNPKKIFLTDITLCELFKGAFKYHKKEESLKVLHEFIRNFTVLGLTVESCEIYGKDFNVLLSIGKPTQDFDLLIASVAKKNNLTLITRNKKHFENIPNLKVEEW